MDLNEVYYLDYNGNKCSIATKTVKTIEAKGGLIWFVQELTFYPSGEYFFSMAGLYNLVMFPSGGSIIIPKHET